MPLRARLQLKNLDSTVQFVNKQKLHGSSNLLSFRHFKCDLLDAAQTAQLKVFPLRQALQDVAVACRGKCALVLHRQGQRLTNCALTQKPTEQTVESLAVRSA